jgi:hypothetical protein
MRDIDAKRGAGADEVRTLVCNAEGVFIWPGVALVERRGNLFVRKPDQEIINLAAALHGPSVIGSALLPALDRAARLLERGQVEQAEGCIARLTMPPLSSTGEVLIRSSLHGREACVGKTFDPDKHPRWPAGSPDSTGGQFSPSDGANEAPFSGQVAQEFPPFFARPPIVPEEIPRFKEPIPRLSGKEGAKDIPSWARGLRPYVGESGRDFSKRVMDGKYGPGKWKETDPEYKQIQKYGDRNFRDPKSIVGPDDDEA